jgi:hypothetical protein
VSWPTGEIIAGNSRNGQVAPKTDASIHKPLAHIKISLYVAVS